MIRALLAFARERFPPVATLPLAAALAAGPLARRGAGAAEFARAVGAAWLALLLLRIADDLADLDADRAFHPGRGLARGTIDAGALRCAVVAGLLPLVVLAWEAAAWVLAGAAFYAAFYRLRSALPRWAHPLAVNVAFAVLPLAAAGAPRDAPDALLAAFVYAAALGHEWSHDVHAPGERAAGFPSLANAYGARRCAHVAAALYALAALLGAAFWIAAGKPAPFGVTLLAACAGLAALLGRLAASPDEQRARPTYVAGAAFWALPALALLVG